MNPENLEKSINLIKENLAPLAEKIGQGVGWTYELFVRQVYVNAFTNLLWMPIGIGAFVLLRKLSKMGFKKSRYGSYKYDQVAVWFGIIILGFVGLLATLSPISDLIQALVNPNYQAIKLIIDLVKTQTH